MNQITVVAGCALFALAGQAAANCTSPQVTGDATLLALLDNQLVCGTGKLTGVNIGDNWQEWHKTGGVLNEYAKGPSDPVDPSQDVGFWSIPTGTNTVKYNYGPTTSSTPEFTYTVHNNTGTYSFCVAGVEYALVSISGPGGGPCSGFP